MHDICVQYTLECVVNIPSFSHVGFCNLDSNHSQRKQLEQGIVSSVPMGTILSAKMLVPESWPT